MFLRSKAFNFATYFCKVFFSPIVLIFEICSREPWPDVSAELSARKAPEFLTKYILHYIHWKRPAFLFLFSFFTFKVPPWPPSHFRPASRIHANSYRKSYHSECVTSHIGWFSQNFDTNEPALVSDVMTTPPGCLNASGKWWNRFNCRPGPRHPRDLNNLTEADCESRGQVSSDSSYCFLY